MISTVQKCRDAQQHTRLHAEQWNDYFRDEAGVAVGRFFEDDDFTAYPLERLTTEPGIEPGTNEGIELG